MTNKVFVYLSEGNATFKVPMSRWGWNRFVLGMSEFSGMKSGDYGVTWKYADGFMEMIGPRPFPPEFVSKLPFVLPPELGGTGIIRNRV